ncbi:MAG TPA: HTTM domain-containing protein, partial [Polyangiaceae bacterium]|nr:HTTM domain-containing protein [Polyangiaceae bacterium]
HYYLVSLISLLLVVLPSDATWSVAAWWRARRGREAPVVRLAHYGLLRAQLAIVYFFAGAAKLNGDWLLRAQPLRIWLRHFWEWPVVGPVFAWPGTAHGMSWFGAVFDLGVALAMSFRRTRPLAWLLAVAFHVTIGLMFPIGVFSFVMLASLTCFNEPQWPRRLLGRRAPAAAAPAPGGQVGAIHSAAGLSWSFYVFAVPYLCIQLLVPLRFALYPGWVNWTEQGFRFAWRVMLIEKTGHVDFHVTTSDPPRHWVTDGSSELTRLQLKMMSTQPDMIHEYALHLAERTRHELGVSEVAVRADAWVAFNGRRSQRLVDPEVDLAAQPRSLAHSSWILPLR